MFKSPRKSLRENTDSTARTDRYIHYLARSIICLGLLSSPLGLMPLLAAPIAPGTSIENQATGSFTDGEDPAALAENIVSNVVKVTVAEVAGITVGPGTASEAPTSVANPGPFQGDGTINVGDIAYFDYVITNAGNDPTQFFIPGAPSSFTGGTFDGTTNPIQIIAYDPGTGSVPVTVNVPTSGQRTGPTTATGTDGLLGKNGIIPAGGTVTIRVPIKVNSSAAVGFTVSATIGKSTTPGANEVYSNSTTNHDLYTQDNVDGTTNTAGAVVETAGMPVNGNGTPGDGIATNHRQESSNVGSTPVIIEPINITGKVFEDVNYGGGAGRDLTSSIGIVRPNVRVELYAADGTYLGATLTDANGQYKFNQFNATTAFTAGKAYKVRVVNSFVTSSRTGGCDGTTATLTTAPTSCTQVPVQTFRTSGDTDANNIADADPNRVGGELPAKIDAGANTTSQNLSALTTGNNAVESLTTVNLGTLAFSGVDFGYNFDTIVNTSDAGQGSLRQFIINANGLGGEASLAQAGNRKNSSNVNQPLPTGKETSIFMIPDGTAHAGLTAGLPNQLTSGFAQIVLASALPTITGSNANNTYLDATTQTVNVGDTNAGQLGTGGTVGVGVDGVAGTPDDRTLSKVYAPEVEIKGNNTIQYGLTVDSTGDVFRGFSLYGNGIDYNTTGSDINWSGNSGLIEQSVLGTAANSFTDPGTGVRSAANHIRLGGTLTGMTIQNNLIGFAGGRGILVRNSDTLTITNNEIRSNNRGNPTTGINGGGIELISFYAGGANTNLSIEGNLITGHGSDLGVEVAYGANDANITIDQNTITDNALGLYFTQSNNNSPNFIRYNSIHDNAKQGIAIDANGGNSKTISKNSIYDNGMLGIDLNSNGGYGVSPNDGLKTGPNQGMDYPIMTAASVSVVGSNSTLSIKGYVGNVSTGSATFKDAKIEFFVGAADTNDKGRVFSSDPASVSKLHAEGQTYLGTCTADANGLFGTAAMPCSFTVPAGTNPLKITSTATDPQGNTSEFSAPVASDPNVLLVKRITAINGLHQKLTGESLSTYHDEASNPYDDNDPTILAQPTPSDPPKDTDKWPTPSTFLLGDIDAGIVKPKDKIEYTIYFLSTGDSTATNVLFCDRVPNNVSFIPNAYNSLPLATGATDVDRGIAVQLGTILKGHTNTANDDLAQYFPPGVEPSTMYPNINCGKDTFGNKLPNDNGAVVVNLGTIPNATGVGTPPESSGFVRFQGRVK